MPFSYRTRDDSAFDLVISTVPDFILLFWEIFFSLD
jgi:hypothetical protein